MARSPKGSGGASAGPGHNSEKDDKDAQALHMMHVKDYESALEKKKSADAAFKNVCKTIKSEGDTVDNVKRTILLRTPEGEKATKAEIENILKIARWNGIPIGTQTELFPEDRTPLVDRAFAEGERAGMAGENTANCPHDPSTEAGQKWIEGWHSGQAVIARRLGKPADQELIRQQREKDSDEFEDALGGDGDGDEAPDEEAAEATTH